MNTDNIAVFRYTLNKIKFEKPSNFIVTLMATINSIITTISERFHVTGDRFTKIMMKLSIVKLALATITLIVMTVLFFSHLDAFDTITIQFSKWVSSPIICFITLVIVTKFVGLGVGLTLTYMSIKDLKFADLKIKSGNQIKHMFHICAKSLRCSGVKNQRKSPAYEIGCSVSIRQTAPVSK